MHEDLHNMDDLFKRAINDLEETPGDRVWANLDKNLDKKKVVFLSKRYNKLKWAAAALLIFSAGLAMYTFNTKLKNKELVKENRYNRDKADENRILNEDKGVKSIAPFQDEVADTVAKEGASAGRKKERIAVMGKKGVEELEVLKDTSKEKAAIAKAAEDGNSDNRLEKSTGKNAVLKNQLLTKEKFSANVTNSDISTEAQGFPYTFIDGNSVTIAKPVELATAYESKEQRLPNLPGISPGVNLLKPELTQVATAKKSSVRISKKSRFSATVFHSVDFASSKVVNNRFMFREDDRREIKNKEKITGSSSQGVLISYHTGKNFAIQSGVTFSSQSTSIQPKIIYARPDNGGNINFRFNCSAGYSFVTLKSSPNAPVIGDSIRTLSSVNNLQYVGVPLALSYNVAIGNFSLQPTAGITANFLTHGNIETAISAPSVNEKATIHRIEGLNSSYYSGLVGLTANYYVHSNIGISFMPVARFALSSINKNAPVKTYINSFGLGAGLSVRL